jgi:tetratricopeptide (TPR) repeat protein
MDNHEEMHDKSADSDDVYVASAVDSQTPPHHPPSGRWFTLLSVSAVIALVMGPVVYLGLPGEISRWYVAAAMELQLDGETDKAIQRLEIAESWSPDNPVLYTYRGDWKLEEGDYRGSIQEYKRALQMNKSYTNALVQRSQALQHLGRHDEAIADWKTLLEDHSFGFSGRRAMFLNGLAYAQALGNTELDAALENVEEAVRLVGQDGAILDTRGFIHYLRGDLESAIADLDLAVKKIEAGFKPQLRDHETRQYVDRRTAEANLRKAAQSVAVIHYHRALVYDALGKPGEAETDRRRVRELGFEPDDNLF